MSFNNLHDFIEYNYENGYYDNQYSNHYHNNTMKDYDLRYYQAKKAYENNGHFRHYLIKKAIIIIMNKTKYTFLKGSQ